MNMEGLFWYSEKQDELYRGLYGHQQNALCNINGRILRYSQWNVDNDMLLPSNWKDAVCLGYGAFHGFAVK